MRYRTVICVWIVVVPLIAGCGLFNNEQKPEQTEDTSPDVETFAAPPAYFGATSLEERIGQSEVIARIRLLSVSPEVNAAKYIEQWWGPNFRTDQTAYAATLEFKLQVLEYLKGTGVTEIVAVAMDLRHFYNTEDEAQAALAALEATRDTRWDEREAIIFLRDSDNSLSSTQQASHYFLGLLTVGYEDGYTVASRWNKLWLPAETTMGSGGQQRFLLDVPSDETDQSPVITLDEMKTRIAEITDELNGDDGSEEFRQCVLLTYELERRELNYWEQYPSRQGSMSVNAPPHDHKLGSGLAAGTLIYGDDDGFGYLPDNREQVWLTDGDAALFNVVLGDVVPSDESGDGVNDAIRFTRRVESSRPLPAGEYQFHFNNRGAFFLRCDGYTNRYEWTVTATAPAGTLHELFFDPVTVGTAVAADSTNGVLKPVAFTDANGASATIQRIEWQAGMVKLRVSPHTAIAGQVLDIIELDGAVSLSLDVEDATVDPSTGSGQAGTLSWNVSEQPWEDGDLLMVRIREGW